MDMCDSISYNGQPLLP